MTLPSSWQLKKIKDIFTVVGGGTPSTSIESNWLGDIPWISSADIHGLKDIRPRRFINDKAINSSATNLVPGGTIIVVTRVGLGKVVLAPYPLCFSQDSQGLIPKIQAFSPDYILYFLSIATQNFKYVSRGTTIPGVTKKQLEDLVIPLPPLPDQERIVERIESLFTQLDAGVSGLKHAQTAIKRYRASVLKAACEGRLVPQDPDDEPAQNLLLQNQTKDKVKRIGRLWGSGEVPSITNDEKLKIPLTWEWVKVIDLGFNSVDVVQVGPMSMQSRNFVDKGIPVLNVGCVQWGWFNESKLNFLPDEKAKEFDRYRIKPGDVLFTRSGTVGRSAVAKAHQKDWLMTFHLLRVRLNDNICLPTYLQIVFDGASHIRRQTRDASIGTTRAGFNTNLLAKLDIPLPPLAEQFRIIAEVERRLSVVEEMESAVAAGLARASRLRQSILKLAFEGRLVGQDTAMEEAVQEIASSAPGGSSEAIQPPLFD